MKLTFCPAGELFLRESENEPDFYIVIEGSVLIRQKTRKEFQVGPFEIFGYTKKLNQACWVASTVTAVEDCSIVTIQRKKFRKLMKTVLDLTENNRLLEFLIKSMPGVRQLGQAGKDKVLSYFKKKNYKPGDLLIAEGTLCDFAFIIEAGECKLISCKNPLKNKTPIYQGLISQTTSQYNIGVATVGEWVGDDSLIRTLPIEFSVIALSSVSVLRICKSDFFEGLSRDTQIALKESMESKLRWRRERKKQISMVITKEIAQTNENDVIKLANTEKIYPIANKSTIRLITKRAKAANSPDGLKLRFSPYEERQNTSFSICKDENARKSMFENHKNKEKVKLYSAGTIGYSLIPVVNSSKCVNLKKKFRKGANLTTSRQTKVFTCYGQQVRLGRPPSPNPADVWARSHNISLYK